MLKKSQIWGFDLLIAVAIFLFGIIIFYFYAMNFNNESAEVMESLIKDGNIMSNMVLSEGSPSNWTLDNVLSPGILSSNKIDEIKLSLMINLTRDSYNFARTLFNTKFDFYFFLDEKINSEGNLYDGFGKPGVERNNLGEYKDLIKVERFTVYKNKPVKLTLFIWK